MFKVGDVFEINGTKVFINTISSGQYHLFELETLKKRGVYSKDYLTGLIPCGRILFKEDYVFNNNIYDCRIVSGPHDYGYYNVNYSNTHSMMLTSYYILSCTKRNNPETINGLIKNAYAWLIEQNSQETSHVCTYKTYVGFSETYEYCTVCDNKK